MNPEMTVKPQVKWFLLPGIALVIGAVLLAVGIVGIVAGVGTEKQELAPGSAITIEKGGRCSIYYEYRFAYRLNEDVVFVFTDSDRRAYQSSFPGGTASYTVGGVSGELVAVVELPPGTYTVETTQQDPELAFVLQEGSMAGGLVGGIMGTVFGGILLVFSCIALIIMLVVRGANKRRLRQQYPHDYQ